MSIDFAALTGAVGVSLPEVRACLMVSRDGLALAAFPQSEEERALDVWSRVAGLGEVDRGFVMVEDEVWAFCRRGPYLALAIAGIAARPGLLLDRLDHMLLSADEARTESEGSPSGHARPASPVPDTGGNVRSTIPSGPEESIPPRDSSRPLALRPPVEPGPPRPSRPDPSPSAQAGTEPIVIRDRPANGQVADPPSPPQPDRRQSSEQPSPAVDQVAASPSEPARGNDERLPERPQAESSPEPDEDDVDVMALAREFAGLINDTRKEKER